MLGRKLSRCRHRCCKGYLRVAQSRNHGSVVGMTIMFRDFRAFEHPRKHPFGMRIQRLDPFGQIILRGKVVFVDRLEQRMQRGKGHTGYIPVKILRQHRCHGRLGHTLIQRLGDSLTGGRARPTFPK